MSKKNLFLIGFFIFLIICLVFLGNLTFYRILNKATIEKQALMISEKNTKTIFTIDNIVCFSSAYANTNVSNNSNFVLENLAQYTDIAIFINNHAKTEQDYTKENTLKAAYINNIQFNKTPEVGTPKLYYKDMNHFAKSSFLEENVISDSINFQISSEDEKDMTKPTLYNNCANPITLSYVNQNLKTNYTLKDSSGPLTYDGSLLKKCNILLNTISCSITFDIYLVNNLDQEFKCPVHIDIPLEDEGNSIYNGNFILKNNTNYMFYRFK